MKEIEIATRFLQKINRDSSLVVTDCSGSFFDGDNQFFTGNAARKLTCRLYTNGKDASKSLILLRTPLKWINYQMKTVPILESILQRISSEFSQLAPQILEFYDQNTSYIIVEDLTDEKFKNVSDIGIGSLQIARYLAAFHSASIVMFRENPSMRDEFGKSVNPDLSQVIEHVSGIVGEIDSWSDQKWSQKIQKLLPNWKEYLNQDSPDLFQVLNHGEPVSKNILMRYRGCGLWDVRFQDFSRLMVHSPVYDLMHFIMSSISSSLRFKELDHTLKYYHSSFVQFSALLGVPADWTYEQLRRDFKKKIHLMFFFFCYYHGPNSNQFDRLHFLEGLRFFDKENLFA